MFDPSGCEAQRKVLNTEGEAIVFIAVSLHGGSPKHHSRGKFDQMQLVVFVSI